MVHVVEELELQAHAIRNLQEDVFVMKKVLGKLFKVLKERGLVEGTYVMGAWIK